MKGIISLPVSAKVKFLLSLAATILGAVVLAVEDGHLDAAEVVTIVVGLIGSGGVFAGKNKPPAPGSGYQV
ncbi:MAG TPA: hypothetical protein VID07_05485 [Actinomycetes bacterium]|jgi:hypothetical protein